MSDLPGSTDGGMREALEHVECGAISVVDGKWGVESPAWWNGFDGPDLDAARDAGLIRVIPSKRNRQNVKITAAGRRWLEPPK